MTFVLSISFFALAGLLAVSTAAQAQSVPPPATATTTKPVKKMIDGRKVYRFVTQMPVYLDGGQDNLQAFITSNVRGASSGSKAFVTFVIDQNGKARNPALGPESAPDASAVEPELAAAFSSIGQFRPGHQNGKPVDVEFTVPLVKPAKKQ